MAALYKPMIIFVHGYLGSLLFYDSPKLFGRRVRHLWLNAGEIARGGIIDMSLGRDGISPLDGVGSSLSTVGVLYEDYFPFVEKLIRTFPAEDYDVLPFIYDWRKSPVVNGEDLARTIELEHPNREAIYVVGHSMGGIVGRYAWRALQERDSEYMMSRLLTIATPHEGSYYQMRIVGGSDTLTLHIGNLMNNYRQDIVGAIIGSHSRIAQAMATWPAFWLLMPHATDRQKAIDSRVQEVWEESSYPPWLIQHRGKIAEYRQEFILPLQDNTTKPPRERMNVIVFTGERTDTKFSGDYPLHDSRLVEITEDGDGTVDVESQKVPGYKYWSYRGIHLPGLTRTFSDDELRQAVLFPMEDDAFGHPSPGDDPEPVVYANQSLPTSRNVNGVPGQCVNGGCEC